MKAPSSRMRSTTLTNIRLALRPRWRSTCAPTPSLVQREAIHEVRSVGKWDVQPTVRIRVRQAENRGRGSGGELAVGVVAGSRDADKLSRDRDIPTVDHGNAIRREIDARDKRRSSLGGTSELELGRGEDDELLVREAVMSVVESGGWDVRRNEQEIVYITVCPPICYWNQYMILEAVAAAALALECKDRGLVLRNRPPLVSTARMRSWI
ncbi:hypothetical protein B0H13DRAFT_2349496 [Mycena leptocephala]|nr:hypothetical protein B0H13DRAFT_2349496 [Mycena leptocephala]